jgi:hypothetical protein
MEDHLCRMHYDDETNTCTVCGRVRPAFTFPPLTCGGGRPVTWHYQLDTIKGQDLPTNSVTIYSRPFMEIDESGEHEFEKFNTVTLTRAEVRAILDRLEEDIAEMRYHCPNHKFI